MNLPWSNSNYKIQIINDEDPSPQKSNKYDAKSIFVLFFTLFVATGTMTYILCRAQQHQTETHLKGDEFRKLVQSIFMETNEILKDGDVMVEIQVLDNNHNLLWFKSIDEESLKDEERMENEIVNEFEKVENEILRQPSIRQIRNVDSSRTREYVVSHQTQFVNCDRFKPIPRGKYLVPPSLDGLHKCYEYGVTMEELDRGLLKREQGSQLRYNLPELYIACHDVFNSQMDELTSELRVDYEKCKWSGALDDDQQKAIEERFAPLFDPSNAPSNLEVSSPSYSPTTLPPPTTLLPVTTTATTQTTSLMDPTWFVDCSHVETEFFEDSFESPSPEALHCCQKFGVTYDELLRGIYRNPQPEQTRMEVANLYLHCEDVFYENLDYLTNELKDDYRKCKRANAISKDTQAKVENKFYEVLYDKRDVTSRRPDRPSTSTTTAEILMVTDDNFEPQTTAETTTTVVANTPSAFANNCKRIENKDYYICIKVIATYNSPVINV